MKEGDNMTKTEILESVKNIGVYDTVCRYYWQMDKMDLVDLVKELDYTIYDCRYDVGEMYFSDAKLDEYIDKKYIENLELCWEDELEEEKAEMEGDE